MTSIKRRKTHKIMRQVGTKEWCTSATSRSKHGIVSIDGEPGPDDKIVKFVEVRYGDILMAKSEYVMMWQLMDNAINAGHVLTDLIDRYQKHVDRPEAEAHLSDALVQLDEFMEKIRRRGVK